MLHQTNLGIFKTLVDIMRKIASEVGPHILPELDRRLLFIKDAARYYN
jgi:hypothetical protein